MIHCWSLWLSPWWSRWSRWWPNLGISLSACHFNSILQKIKETSSPCYCQILHKILDIGSIATTAVIAIAAIFVLPQVRRLPCFGEYRHHHILQDLHMTIVIIILSLILSDKVDPNSEQAIYWITGINLSTFSFSRSDDPDASGLVFVWPLISKSWIDRIARKIITSTLRWVSPTPWTTPSLSSTLMGKAAWQSRCKL